MPAQVYHAAQRLGAEEAQELVRQATEAAVAMAEQAAAEGQLYRQVLIQASGVAERDLYRSRAAALDFPADELPQRVT